MNYIPASSNENGSYMCTWHCQDRVARKYKITGDYGSPTRDALTPEYLFGSEDDYHWLPREYRSGLYFLLDDGWDIPPHTENRGEWVTPLGAAEPDPIRFGKLGRNGEERLAALNRMAQDMGYIGLGLWIAPQMCMEDTRVPAGEAFGYWKERALWSQRAGVRYWKVDWGAHDKDVAYRRMLTEVVKTYAPDVSIEHAYIQKPLTWMTNAEERARLSREIFSISDYFRSYDVMWPMAESATLARLHEVLQNPLPFEMGVKGMLNMEYRTFIAAGLGGTIGAMDPSIEINAVLRWQRLSPPFSAMEAKYACSEELLTDSYYYPRNPVGWVPTAGKVITETAPAVMVRGCALPEVRPLGREKPFVVASRNPRTGAYAISTIRRNIEPNPLTIAPADILWRVEDERAFVGVFGFFNSLTLIYPNDLPADCRVFAQNLMDSEARDITEMVRLDGRNLTISGRVLSGIGACNYSYPEIGDLKMSDPMLLIKIEGLNG